MTGIKKYFGIGIFLAFLLMGFSVYSFAAMKVLLKDGRVVIVPVNKDDIIGISFEENPSATGGGRPRLLQYPQPFFGIWPTTPMSTSMESLCENMSPRFKPAAMRLPTLPTRHRSCLLSREYYSLH